MLLLHRVKFALYNGWLPERIDHKDGDRTNNKIGTLRPCTPSQNAANASYSNRPMPVSGLRNVYLMPNGKYKGRAQLGERRQWTIAFDTATEAKEAIEALRKAHHGDYHRRTHLVRLKPISNIAKKRQPKGRA